MRYLEGRNKSPALLYSIAFAAILAVTLVITEKVNSSVPPQDLADRVFVALSAMYGLFISADILSFFVRPHEGSRGRVITIWGRDKWVNGVTALIVVVLVVVLVVVMSEFISFDVVPTAVDYLASLERFVLPFFFSLLIPLSPMASFFLRGNLNIMYRVAWQVACFHAATITGSLLAAYVPLVI